MCFKHESRCSRRAYQNGDRRSRLLISLLSCGHEASAAVPQRQAAMLCRAPAPAATGRTFRRTALAGQPQTCSSWKVAWHGQS